MSGARDPVRADVERELADSLVHTQVGRPSKQRVRLAAEPLARRVSVQRGGERRRPPERCVDRDEIAETLVDTTPKAIAPTLVEVLLLQRLDARSGFAA